MQTVDIVIMEDLFKAVGLTVGRCSAYTEDSDSFVRINGGIFCNSKWDEDFCLRVKANLCNDADEIVRVDYDFDLKTFINIWYESFSVNCYKGNIKNIKYVELHPQLVKASAGREF